MNNQTGVRTDFRGYTLIPYVTPYREGTVTLSTETLPDDADIGLTSQTITPTRGAIVRARFDTRVGKRVLITLIRRNGQAVPFGAMVTDSRSVSSIVGDGGQVYLSGMENSGTATVKWGNSTNEQCQISWQLPETTPASGVVELTTVCQ